MAASATACWRSRAGLESAPDGGVTNTAAPAACAHRLLPWEGRQRLRQVQRPRRCLRQLHDAGPRARKAKKSSPVTRREAAGCRETTLPAPRLTRALSRRAHGRAPGPGARRAATRRGADAARSEPVTLVRSTVSHVSRPRPPARHLSEARDARGPQHAGERTSAASAAQARQRVGAAHAEWPPRQPPTPCLPHQVIPSRGFAPGFRLPRGAAGPCDAAVAQPRGRPAPASGQLVLPRHSRWAVGNGECECA